MSTISLVVAVSRNGVIGRGGRLPWHISSDLKLFKALTMGKPVIMGRKTWEGLPRKPLPGRSNIIITRQHDFVAEGAEVVADAAAALAKAGEAEEIAVIGGGEIYQMFLPVANRIYMTFVDLDVDGDTFFPLPDVVYWTETRRQAYPRDVNDDAEFELRVYDRNL